LWLHWGRLGTESPREARDNGKGQHTDNQQEVSRSPWRPRRRRAAAHLPRGTPQRNSVHAGLVI